MLSQVSVDEVFMHYFQYTSSASGASPPYLHRGSVPEPRWETSVPNRIICPPLEKNLAGARTCRDRHNTYSYQVVRLLLGYTHIQTHAHTHTHTDRLKQYLLIFAQYIGTQIIMRSFSAIANSFLCDCCAGISGHPILDISTTQ